MKKFFPGSEEGWEWPRMLKMHPNDGILLVQAVDEVENKGKVLHRLTKITKGRARAWVS